MTLHSILIHSKSKHSCVSERLIKGSLGYGIWPNVMISYSKIPKDQMSDLMENVLSWMASGAVHFTGNLVPSLASYTFSFSF